MLLIVYSLKYKIVQKTCLLLKNFVISVKMISHLHKFVIYQKILNSYMNSMDLKLCNYYVIIISNLNLNVQNFYNFDSNRKKIPINQIILQFL